MIETLNRKGILAFLGITFGITYLMEGILILAGFRITQIPPIIAQYTLLIAMWVPALATYLTTRFVTKEKLSSTWPSFGGSWKPYLATALLIPLLFVITYGITWSLGLGWPDWQLNDFFGLFSGMGFDMSSAPSPAIILAALGTASLIIAPFLNSLFAFGEEWGWRGFLLPRLMPLGKFKAYLILGVIWGLWHAPMIAIGFNYPGQPVAGIFMMIGMTTALGIFINEITLRYKSAILAGWAHGVFNSQAYGIWRVGLFPMVNPLIGGITGVVGVIVLLAFGLGTVWYFNRTNKNEPSHITIEKY
ncbi:MAG: CPBP family intramembrane metalloprotease [Chloroflexi bacterium]|nr:CPBP family intramembrane metalloprotease [Chloroflexota bacterium]